MYLHKKEICTFFLKKSLEGTDLSVNPVAILHLLLFLCLLSFIFACCCLSLQNVVQPLFFALCLLWFFALSSFLLCTMSSRHCLLPLVSGWLSCLCLFLCFFALCSYVVGLFFALSLVVLCTKLFSCLSWLGRWSICHFLVIFTLGSWILEVLRSSKMHLSSISTWNSWLGSDKLGSSSGLDTQQST